MFDVPPSPKAITAARKVLALEDKALGGTKHYFKRLDAAYRGVDAFEVDLALEWLEQESLEL